MEVATAGPYANIQYAPRPRQVTTPASHQSVFYRPDALPAMKALTVVLTYFACNIGLITVSIYANNFDM